MPASKSKSTNVLALKWLLPLLNQDRLLKYTRFALPPILYTALFVACWFKPALRNLYYNSLDPSYIYGVQKAAELFESFGSDFTSNYGPFVYSVVNFFPEKLGLTMVWHILASVAIGLGVYFFGKLYIAGKLRRAIGAVLLIATLAMAGPPLVGPEWLYLNIFILYALIYLKLPIQSKFKMGLLYGLAFLSAFYMLSKFTIGLVSIGGLAIILLTESGLRLAAMKKQIIPTAKVMAFYAATLLLVSFSLGVKNIFAYFTSGLEVAAGFSGAMGINDPELYFATFCVMLFFCLLGLWLVMTFRKRPVYFLFLIPILFIIMKYAITRQDAHILVIVQSLFFLIVAVYFTKQYVQRFDIVFMAVLPLLATIAIWANHVEFSFFQRSLFAPVYNIVEGQARYAFDLQEQIDAWHAHNETALQKAILPDTMRATIGNKGVDIFPWEAVMVKANNLTWQHRPQPYSFETYTPALDKMNADFIRNRGAPYIIWHRFDETGTASIDGRHVLWDGPRTLRAVLDNYNLVEASDDFILLERQPDTASYATRVLGQAQGTDWVSIPQNVDGLVCAKVDIKDTLLQKLRKVLVRERNFRMDVQYADGTIRIYRFIKDTAPGGLLVGPLPQTWGEMTTLFSTKKAHAESSPILLKVHREASANITFTDCHE